MTRWPEPVNWEPIHFEARAYGRLLVVYRIGKQWWSNSPPGSAHSFRTAVAALRAAEKWARANPKEEAA